MPGVRPDETAEAEARLLRTLFQLSASAGKGLDPGELVKLVAEHACELLYGDAVALYLWDDVAGLLIPVYGNDTHQHVDDLPLRLGQGAAGQAIRLHKPVVVDDYPRWEHALAWWVERGLKSVEAVPLMVGDRPIGALIVRFYTRRRGLGADENRMLAILAAQVAPALEAARLYAASSLEGQHERALREITEALAENLDERRVLDLAVGYGASLLKAPYARIWLLQANGELSCAAAEGYVHADTFTRQLASDSTSALAARQQVTNIANAPNEPGWHFNRDFGERTGLGAYLGAGLWRAGESLGVLEVMRDSGLIFTVMEEQLLVSLANAVAVAVSNARTHAAVEQLAREAEERAQVVAESERLLRSVYEAIGSGVLVFDQQGRVVNANAAAADILGRRVDQLLGMHSVEFSPGVAEDGTEIRVEDSAYPLVVRTRQPLRKLVFRIQRPDGGSRWLQVDAVPLFGAGGELTRVISSFIDISDRKRSEEALHQRDAILEAVAFAAEQLLTAAEWEHSIDAVLGQLGAATNVSRVYLVRTGTDVSDGYEAAARAYEWTANGVLPRSHSTLNTASLETIGLGRWEPILRQGRIIEGALHSFPPDEQALLTAEGVCSLAVVPIFVGPAWWGFVGFDDCWEERNWPVGTVEVLKTAAGTIGAAILRRQAEAERLQLVREQSARAEAEAAQRRLAFLADASQILAASLDYEKSLQGVAHLVVPGLADCCLIDMLDGDGSLRGVASAVGPAFGSESSKHIPIEIDPAGDHPVALALRTGQPWLTATLPDDYARLVGAGAGACLIVPVIARTGLAGAITWLAAPGRAAYAPRDLGLAQDLARRCALAIDNASLYREARAAVNIRDEFMSVAAHELKTPLTSLRGYAQLLGREFEKGEAPNPARARRAALTIQVQSDKLGRLVGQLLDISRIQSGKLAIERRPADLSALIRDVVEATRPQLRDHALVARVPRELEMRIDPLRIEQVVTNLIDNAIKYSPDGAQIDVSLSDGVPNVRFTVRDHGSGVAPEHRAHIFDRFYQGHTGGPLTSQAGMGLGLYISRQIVELHDGTIEAEFPESGGTCFVVTLPHDPPVAAGDS